MTSPILVTKFFIPPARPELVFRHRLIEQLNSGLERKLTLISAPAGFGKTTLVAEWLEKIKSDQKSSGQTEIKIAWLSLDEGDNQPLRFLSYFITALNRISASDQELGKSALNKLQLQPPAPVETILTDLINEIANFPEKILFVLDDFHLIDNPSIQEAVNFILEHTPPQMHLVITTREDPLLPLSRLRARRQLTEVRASDLRFSTDETADFFNRVMGLNLSAENIAALEARTEGWIAGLQLAAVSLQGQDDAGERISTFSGSHRLVMDYLIEEVLNQQPQSIRNFLLHTAVLNRMNASLCNTLTGDRTSQQTLENLDRANLFVIPLDANREWFRYHHLFADLLLQQLRTTSPDQIAVLHSKACQWYEQNQLPADAIHHAYAAQDFERVAAIAEQVWPQWSDGLSSITWLSWVKNLPEQVVRVRPVLSLAFGWAYLHAGLLEQADLRLQDVENWLEDPESSQQPDPEPVNKMVIVDQAQFQMLPVSLAIARAYHAQAVGDLNAVEKRVARALELIPEEDRYNRASVIGLLGLAYWAAGELESAYRMFSEGLFQNVADTIQGTLVLADLNITLGRLHQAERVCQHGLQLASAVDGSPPIGTEDVYIAISDVHREQGNLQAAAQDLEEAKNLGDKIELPDWRYRWNIAQGRLKMSEYDLEAALHFFNEAEQLYVRTPLPLVRPIPAFITRVLLKLGNLSKAQDWVNRVNLSADDDPSFLQEFEHITLARILIAAYRRDNTEETINDAIRLLERLAEAAETGKRTGSLIEILLLLALAFEAQHDITAALVPLKRALSLAEHQGFVQLFVDEGAPMGRLLLENLKQEDCADFVRQLLAVFPVDKPQKNKPLSGQISEDDWIEPLTERETEILQLIAAGLSNQDIASRLYLSLNTVKAHTRSIYAKISVNSRTQAVSKARALGILEISKPDET